MLSTYYESSATRLDFSILYTLQVSPQWWFNSLLMVANFQMGITFSKMIQIGHMTLYKCHLIRLIWIIFEEIMAI